MNCRGKPRKDVKHMDKIEIVKKESVEPFDTRYCLYVTNDLVIDNMSSLTRKDVVAIKEAMEEILKGWEE